jgi:cellulose synthase/poly-beta-1,6-N-acetylglucosamine synthase-like glycosyltransferase
MSALDFVTAAFWISASLVAYTYAVYPLVIFIASRCLGGRPEAPAPADAGLPTISLILAAYNEEAVIEGRLRNATAMDYPPEGLEILVASDGSTDRTVAIVAGFGDPRVRLLDFPWNRGKASAVNAAVAEARGEIILLSDANTQVDSEAARRLVRWFRDPSVGAAVGRLVLVDCDTGRNADGLYWRYETFLKRCEGRLGAVLGANGAIYAFRRGLYEPIPPATIIDDFVIPLLAKQRTGCAIVYDDEATAVEETAPDVRAEFHRRARIGAGGYQSLGLLWRFFDPRRGWVAFAFLSHKVLRWLCPFFLIGGLGTNLALAARPLYAALLVAQLVFYLIAAVMSVTPARLQALRPFRLTTMFVGMNAALLVGFFRWLGGRQNAAWRRTARHPLGKPALTR